jgi:hypothetical protein
MPAQKAAEKVVEQLSIENEDNKQKRNIRFKNNHAYCYHF